MGRSKATFSKKEKETNKVKKRKEKEEKKEDRKNNNSKGKGIEEMMAYVDEDGNITDTPPDPKKKRIINMEDIQIGVPVREPLDAGELIRNGVVTFFNESKGYGFIKDKITQESLFVHINSIDGQIKENNLVQFEVEMSPKGATAIKVKKI